MAQWKIRPATEADLDVIVRFNISLALESEGLTLDAATVHLGVQKILRNHVLGRYFLAIDGNRVIGQTMINFEPTDWRSGLIVWLQSVYVDRSYRKKGVFKALYTGIQTYCRDHLSEVKLIRLYVERHNQAAIKTYEAIGMKPTSYVVYEADFEDSHEILKFR